MSLTNKCTVCLEYINYDFPEIDWSKHSSGFYTKGDYTYLKCYHVFHKECYEPWIENNNCPNCRIKLDESKEDPVKKPDTSEDHEIAQRLSMPDTSYDEEIVRLLMFGQQLGVQVSVYYLD